MKLPPYGRHVRGAPFGYWARGGKVFIFAGPRAWGAAKAWLDDSHELGFITVMRARWRYTMVLPPDLAPMAGVYRWPVADREVIVVDTGAAEGELQPLIEAIQRDGCAGGEVVDVPHIQAWRLEGYLQCLQAPGLAWCDWDAEVRARRAAIDQQAEGLITSKIRALLGDAEAVAA